MIIPLFFTIQLSLVLVCMSTLSLAGQITRGVPVDSISAAFSIEYQSTLSEGRFFQERKLKPGKDERIIVAHGDTL